LASNESITRNLDAELSAIRSDLKALRDDLSSVARTAGNVAATGKKRAEEMVGEKVEELRAKGSEIGESVGHEIEQHPLTAVAIAFGAGFILGKLLDRR
jgi:ElaB/YqjD/DUF883 family membrane-anchored ribosome-binding protein